MDRPTVVSRKLIETVCARLAADERVRRNLPVWGRLHIDRQLPFLCVYRRPVSRRDPETERMVTAEASYLCAPGQRRYQDSLRDLVREVTATLTKAFGAFLVLEVWSEAEVDAPDEMPPPPGFRVHLPRGQHLPRTVATLHGGLAGIRASKQQAETSIARSTRDHAPGFRSLLGGDGSSGERTAYWLGVSIRPIWRRRGGEQVFPVLRRGLSRRFSRVLRRAFFEFTREKTTHRPAHYHALGKRAMVKAVWEVDRRLAEIDHSFDFLLQLTPVNPRPAYRAFERAGFRGKPVFFYRPLAADPALLKRKLYEIRIERVEDPTLAMLFRQKRRELDLQINMLQERDSVRALYSSLQLYGAVDDDLLAAANRVLDRIPARSREDAGGASIDAESFAQAAREEIAFYRRQYDRVRSTVTVRDDLAGLMVSKGNLMVGSEMRIPASRVEALLQHEVGTHVLTYINGEAQRFQQLHCGLAGYDELQEGLAVFAEYIVGGLSRPRLRQLAGRVVAARALVDGAGFDETFRLLNGQHGFERKNAFTIAMRIHRAGGVTKDAIYLRGLIRLVGYIRDGGNLEPLLVGKIAGEHVAVVRELQRRRILTAPALRPRYLDHPHASRRLERVRQGLTLLDLTKVEKQ